MKTRTFAIARGVGVIGATVALMVGATFATLGSSASLTGNTLATASANLQISLDNITYSPSVQGFNFTGLVPGTDSSGFAFDLKCTGGVPQTITANIPSTPTFSGLNSFAGVHITFTPTSGPAINTDMGSLLGGQVAFGTCDGTGVVQTYTATVNIDKTAVFSSSATMNLFDIVFTGTQT